MRVDNGDRPHGAWYARVADLAAHCIAAGWREGEYVAGGRRWEPPAGPIGPIALTRYAELCSAVPHVQPPSDTAAEHDLRATFTLEGSSGWVWRNIDEDHR